MLIYHHLLPSQAPSLVSNAEPTKSSACCRMQYGIVPVSPTGMTGSFPKGFFRFSPAFSLVRSNFHFFVTTVVFSPVPLSLSPDPSLFRHNSAPFLMFTSQLASPKRANIFRRNVHRDVCPPVPNHPRPGPLPIPDPARYPTPTRPTLPAAPTRTRPACPPPTRPARPTTWPAPHPPTAPLPAPLPAPAPARRRLPCDGWDGDSWDACDACDRRNESAMARTER